MYRQEVPVVIAATELQVTGVEHMKGQREHAQRAQMQQLVHDATQRVDAAEV